MKFRTCILQVLNFIYNKLVEFLIQWIMGIFLIIMKKKLIFSSKVTFFNNTCNVMQKLKVPLTDSQKRLIFKNLQIGPNSAPDLG